MGILKGVAFASRTEDQSFAPYFYLDDGTSYRETAGTALLRAVAYRRASFDPSRDRLYLHWICRSLLESDRGAY